MAPVVYILGILTTLVCAVLLLRGYSQSGKKLLLWSALCFAGLTLSNMVMFVDLVLLPTTTNLYFTRLLIAALAMLMLLYGLIWESE